jgi:hypothetical protein
MNETKWKLSKIQISKDEGEIYSVKGNLNCTLDNSTYIVPFGAMDYDRQVAVEKAKSELCERAVWINMFTLKPDVATSTVGFSAHVDRRKAIINSKMEVFERVEFSRVVRFMKKKQQGQLEKNWNVISKNDVLYFCSRAQILMDVEAYAVIALMKVAGLIYFGMGKSTDFASALDDAKMECKLIQRTLTSEKKHLTDLSTKVMSEGDFILFHQLSRNNRVIQNYDNIVADDSLQDEKSVIPYRNISTDTVDACQYMPKFLVPLNRYVYYSRSTGTMDEYKRSFPLLKVEED